MKSILITGGAGYIGSHVSLSLLQKGFNIFSIDSFINSSYQSVKVLNSYSKNNINNEVGNFYFFKGDIRDEFLLNTNKIQFFGGKSKQSSFKTL